MPDKLEHLEELGNNQICPALVLYKSGKILCGLRHYTPDKWKSISVWTFPGGRCDEGETVGQALLREVAEETGITNLNIKSFLGKVPGAKEGDAVYLYAAETDEDPQLLEPEKFSEWQWFRPEEIPENFINPPALALVPKSLKRINSHR